MRRLVRLTAALVYPTPIPRSCAYRQAVTYLQALLALYAGTTPSSASPPLPVPPPSPTASPTTTTDNGDRYRPSCGAFVWKGPAVCLLVSIRACYLSRYFALLSQTCSLSLSAGLFWAMTPTMAQLVVGEGGRPVSATRCLTGLALVVVGRGLLDLVGRLLLPDARVLLGLPR